MHHKRYGKKNWDISAWLLNRKSPTGKWVRVCDNQILIWPDDTSENITDSSFLYIYISHL